MERKKGVWRATMTINSNLIKERTLDVSYEVADPWGRRSTRFVDVIETAGTANNGLSGGGKKKRLLKMLHAPGERKFP